MSAFSRRDVDTSFLLDCRIRGKGSWGMINLDVGLDDAGGTNFKVEWLYFGREVC